MQCPAPGGEAVPTRLDPGMSPYHPINPGIPIGIVNFPLLLVRNEQKPLLIYA